MQIEQAPDKVVALTMGENHHNVETFEHRECASCKRVAGVPHVADRAYGALVCLSCNAPGLFALDDPKENLDGDRALRLRYEVRFTPCLCGGIMASPGFGEVCVYCATRGTKVVRTEPATEYLARLGKKLRRLRGRVGV